MRASKGSRRIVVRGVEYPWHAIGNDGYIIIGIWPLNEIGAYIQTSVGYQETMVDNGDGRFFSRGDQIVVTNRIVRRIIEYAVMEHGYDPRVNGKQLNLRDIESAIKWDDAVRASDC